MLAVVILWSQLLDGTWYRNSWPIWERLGRGEDDQKSNFGGEPCPKVEVCANGPDETRPEQIE